MEMQRPEFLIVDIDNVYRTALARNIGFIEIHYNEFELTELVFRELRGSMLNLPQQSWKATSRYANAYYPGVEEDRQVMDELVSQLTTMMHNNILLATNRLADSRPVIDLTLQDLTLFVRLG